MHHLFLILALSALAASAAERWEALPPTPAPIHSQRNGQAEANGISIYYAVYGQGSPVILLHGGLANAEKPMNLKEKIERARAEAKERQAKRPPEPTLNVNQWIENPGGYLGNVD